MEIKDEVFKDPITQLSDFKFDKKVVTVLRSEGYVCEVAYSAAEANEKIAIFEYDCIMLHINLPDGDGLKVLEKIKA